jgi:hypothetical protein
MQLETTVLHIAQIWMPFTDIGIPVEKIVGIELRDMLHIVRNGTERTGKSQVAWTSVGQNEMGSKTAAVITKPMAAAVPIAVVSYARGCSCS